MALAAVHAAGPGTDQGPDQPVSGRCEDASARDHRVFEPVPAGMGSYFRTGDAPDKFTMMDRYVASRLKSSLIKKRGRNLRARQADRWTRACGLIGGDGSWLLTLHADDAFKIIRIFGITWIG